MTTAHQEKQKKQGGEKYQCTPQAPATAPRLPERRSSVAGARMVDEDLLHNIIKYVYRLMEGLFIRFS
jgi:hypothetical protein